MIEPIDIQKMMKNDLGKMPTSLADQDKIEIYNSSVVEWIVLFGQNIQGAVKYLKKIKYENKI